MEIELIAALGCASGEAALRELLAAFAIEGKPVARRGNLTAFLQNHPLGVELTFRYAEVLDVPLRNDPPGTLVLSNIGLYGPGSSTHAAFTGDLPFGVHFGATKAMLIGKFGPPDVDSANLPLMRWDTARYALFAEFDKAGKLNRFSLQLPVVASTRPGFEAR